MDDSWAQRGDDIEDADYIEERRLDQARQNDVDRLQGRLEAFAMAMTECGKAEPRNDGYVGGRTWIEVRKAIDILHLHTLREIKALENGS